MGGGWCNLEENGSIMLQFKLAVENEPTKKRKEKKRKTISYFFHLKGFSNESNFILYLQWL